MFATLLKLKKWSGGIWLLCGLGLATSWPQPAPSAAETPPGSGASTNLASPDHPVRTEDLAPAAVFTGAEVAPAPPGSGAVSPPPHSGPLTFTIGAWLQDVYDFNVRDKSFSATVWLWATGQDGKREPLKTLQTVNLLSADKEAAFYGQVQRGDVYWSERRIQGKFRYDWHLNNFPFDKQTLKILLNEGFDDTFALTYVVDPRSSTLSDTLKPDGWLITGFDVQSVPSLYNTSFGDPTLAFDNRSTRPALQISVQMRRDSYSAFLKLTTIMYIAFIISLLTYFMHVENPSIMSPRVSLVAGALFATAINMRSASSALGGDEGVTLVDELHVAALLTILLAATMCLVSRILYDCKARPALVKKLNYAACAAAVLFFVSANILLIAMAAV